MAWLKKSEAAERLGIGVSTLDRLINAGAIPAYRMTGRGSLRVKEEDLDLYIESCRVRTVSTPAQRRRKAIVAPPVCRYRPGDKVV